MSDSPAPRLSRDQVQALKFAAHRQLSRWSDRSRLSPRMQHQRAALAGAVRILQDRAFSFGCELRIPSAEEDADD